MTDTEISQQLAIAIGWPAEQVSLKMVAGQCMVNYDRQYWRMFDYRRPDTIWPICVALNKWPWQEWKYGSYTGRWFVAMPDGPLTGVVEADTAAKAVALAVIKAHEGAKE